MFKPTWLINSIYKITPDMFLKQHIKAVFVDLDNTLIAWNNPNGTEEMFTWLKNLKEANIPVVIISNNHTKRVSKVAEKFNVLFIANAKKPTVSGLKKALELVNMNRKDVVMVGDQLLTDILAGNRFGVRTILVKPLINSDMLFTRFNRLIEKQILQYLKKQKKIADWRDTLE